MKSIAFYNAKAGVGCTSLVYHLAWMYAELGYRVVAVDADPQGDLSGLILGFDVVPWLEFDEERPTGASVADAIAIGVVDGKEFLTSITPRLALVLGSLRQEHAIAEDTDAHGLCFSGSRSKIPNDLATARVRRMVAAVGKAQGADLVLIDTSPGLGVCSCLAVTAADAVVFPVTRDDTALHGLRESVHAAKTWRWRWDSYVGRLLDPANLRARRDRNRGPGEPFERIDEQDAAWMQPSPTPLGHVVTGDAHYGSVPVRPQFGAERLAQDIAAFADSVAPEVKVELGALTRWVALRELSLQHRKPMFALSPADGASGSTAKAVQLCRAEYRALATSIAARLGVAPAAGP